MNGLVKQGDKVSSKDIIVSCDWSSRLSVIEDAELSESGSGGGGGNSSRRTKSSPITVGHGVIASAVSQVTASLTHVSAATYHYLRVSVFVCDALIALKSGSSSGLQKSGSGNTGSHLSSAKQKIKKKC